MQTACDEGWHPFKLRDTEKCIKPVALKFRDYHDAKRYCQDELDANPVTIKSFTENHYILSLIGGEKLGQLQWPIGFWLGNAYFPKYANKLVYKVWPNIWDKVR